MANAERSGIAEKAIFVGNAVDVGFLIGGLLTGNAVWAIWGILGLAGGKWAQNKVADLRKKGVWIP
jgi:hypothetical protein